MTGGGPPETENVGDPLMAAVGDYLGKESKTILGITPEMNDTTTYSE